MLEGVGDKVEGQASRGSRFDRAPPFSVVCEVHATLEPHDYVVRWGLGHIEEGVRKKIGK